MKKLLKLLPVILLTLVFAACSDDEDDFEQEYHVTYIVTCNNPQAHVRIWNGAGDPIIMGRWKHSFTTKAGYTGCTIDCIDDPLATITFELYVNGRYKFKKSDYGEIKIVYKLNEHSY
jgi:hypothetical protein